tara:strand:- start:545 stop:817 length:273 start_codon:yes stop_codon:yes gene_type:complete
MSESKYYKVDMDDPEYKSLKPKREMELEAQLARVTGLLKHSCDIVDAYCPRDHKDYCDVLLKSSVENRCNCGKYTSEKFLAKPEIKEILK